MFQDSNLLKPFSLEGELHAAKNCRETEPMVFECFVLAQRPRGSQMEVRQRFFEGTYLKNLWRICGIEKLQEDIRKAFFTN